MASYMRRWSANSCSARLRGVMSLAMPIHSTISPAASSMGTERAVRPANGSIRPEAAMLAFEHALAGDRFLDRAQHALAIVRKDVLLEPFAVRQGRRLHEHASLELAQFAEIRAHAKHHVGARGHQRAKPRFTICETLLRNHRMPPNRLRAGYAQNATPDRWMGRSRMAPTSACRVYPYWRDQASQGRDSRAAASCD